MTRRLTCDGDKASDRFDICWMAFHLGRVMLLNDAQGKQSRDERRKDFGIIVKLKKASAEADEKADKLQTGEPQRKLVEGSVIELAQPELDRLLACIDRIGWNSSKLEAVEDTIDWLSSSEKVEA